MPNSKNPAGQNFYHEKEDMSGNNRTYGVSAAQTLQISMYEVLHVPELLTEALRAVTFIRSVWAVTNTITLPSTWDADTTQTTELLFQA